MSFRLSDHDRPFIDSFDKYSSTIYRLKHTLMLSGKEPSNPLECDMVLSINDKIGRIYYGQTATDTGL